MDSPVPDADLSMSSSDSQQEDWDRSMSVDESPEAVHIAKTPRNSVAFPGDGGQDTPQGAASGGGKRSLSELLRLHAEEGTQVTFTPEEAGRVADVLGQWINASSSPYEGEDDFFSRSHDDLSLKMRKSPLAGTEVRPRGHSESANTSRSRSVSMHKS